MATIEIPENMFEGGSTAPATLEPGKYWCRVKDTELKADQFSEGHKTVLVKMDVCGEDKKWHNASGFLPLDPEKRVKLKNFLLSIGEEKTGTINTDSWIGKDGYAEFKHNNNGYLTPKLWLGRPDDVPPPTGDVHSNDDVPF